MSKLCTYSIRKPIHRYKPIVPPRHLLSPKRTLIPGRRPLGWQPSRFLADRAEAEHAFAQAEQLSSVNAAAAELGPPGRRSARPLPGTAWVCLPATAGWSGSGRSSPPAAGRRVVRLENHFLRQLCAVSIDSEGSLSMPWRRLTRTTRLA